MSVAPDVLRTTTGREATRWVLDHCRSRPWLSIATVLTTVTGAALQILPVLLLSRVIDIVTRGEPHSALVTVGAVMMAAVLLGAATTAVSTYLIGKLGADLLADLREGAVRAVLELPSSRIEQAGHGDVLSRVGDDVAILSKGIRTAVPTVLSAGVLVTVATIGMFGLDWRLGLAGSCALIAYASALRWYLPRSAPLYREQRIAQANRAQTLISALNGIHTVRAYRLEKTFQDKVAHDSARVKDLGIEVFHFFGRFVGRENRAEFIGLTAILTVGHLLVGAGATTVGAVAAALLAFHRLFTPLGSIMFTFDEAQKSGASLTRLVGVLAESPGERLVGTPSPGTGRTTACPVVVESVTFTYPGTDHPVLHEVTLTIPAGGSLALVGATGAGKTTLAALVAGIGTPGSGTVRIGSTDLSQVDEAAARSLVSVLTQESHLFSGTLADDLRLAAPDADDAALRAALRLVGAEDWVDALPEGLHTPVGEGGEPLDGTKAAHIALARLVLTRTPVVVLDESTAEAGSEGASALERAAQAACSGRTSLFVAHRLTQAAAADRIAVLDAGRIVEEGTHEELVAKDGHYAQLWRAWQGLT
ncbi:ATP-binding cassette, subfamily C [Austwickia chelonae]|uniref:Putative ABC transporter permease/ATP-binding protein n=1 Tax=Austwickia chelonae NBRC 105200 TaxID=1184607 RepID=K6VL63_9MICO|nr:ABC transporter ATP-binding protein [Austwickia chelonae]GAB77469.1 putative ABC transporter permease/ATP-binding protein [Austwickia chelonae NBRC 105200]SEW11063.1 ATP-binding cassette, subfamily C [Austwickia chelonae]